MTDETETNAGKLGEITDAMLEEMADRVAEYLANGVLGPDSALGIYPHDLELEADDLVVSARLGDEVLLEHSFEPESWERIDTDDPGFDHESMAEELSLEIYDRVDLKQRLVERRLERLADLLLDGAEAEIQSRLEDAVPEIDWDVTVDVVELPYDYQHGDPDWVYEQGYPPYGFEVLSWDPDAETVVEITAETPKPERLIDEAVSQLLDTLAVERGREQLETELLERAEEAIQAELGERFPEHELSTSAQIVELVPPDDHPPGVGPPFGLRARIRIDDLGSSTRWVIVPIDPVEPDPQAVIEETLDRLYENLAVKLERTRAEPLLDEVETGVRERLAEVDPDRDWGIRFSVTYRSGSDVPEWARQRRHPPLNLRVQIREGERASIYDESIEVEVGRPAPDVEELVRSFVEALLEAVDDE